MRREVSEGDTGSLVSVVVPCFNQGQYLQPMLNSVSNACSFFHEVIVVDDGSTDPLTLRFLDEILSPSAHQSVRVLRQKNRGLSAARNAGTDASQLKYIQFLDADDMLAGNKIDRQVRLLENDSSMTVHLTDYMFCDEEGSRFWSPYKSTLQGFDFSVRDFVAYWERGLSIPIHCALFRRETISGIRFNENLRAKEDWIFWISLAVVGARLCYSPFVGAIYRQHENNMCKDGIAMAISWLKAWKLIRDSGIPIDGEDERSFLDHYNSYYVELFTRQASTKPGYAGRYNNLNFLLSLGD